MDIEITYDSIFDEEYLDLQVKQIVQSEYAEEDDYQSIYFFNP